MSMSIEDQSKRPAEWPWGGYPLFYECLFHAGKTKQDFTNYDICVRLGAPGETLRDLVIRGYVPNILREFYKKKWIDKRPKTTPTEPNTYFLTEKGARAILRKQAENAMQRPKGEVMM